MSDIATSLISDDEREYLILQKRAISGADDGTYEWALNEIERLREALTIALSALVAATSLLKRSEDEKVKPSRAVASNKIFRLMMADYERAEDNARAALGEGK